MSDKDYLIGPGIIPNVGQLNKKPLYLVVVESPEVKSKFLPIKYFISLDKPNFESNMVCCKGFFTDANEAEINKNYTEMYNNTPKENFEELMFPIQRVVRIKNLVFKAK